MINPPRRCPCLSRGGGLGRPAASDGGIGRSTAAAPLRAMLIDDPPNKQPPPARNEETLDTSLLDFNRDIPTNDMVFTIQRWRAHKE